MSADELTAPLPAGGVRFTDRSDGNMSSVGGDGAALGAANRARLREQLGLAGIARGYQVHGAHVQLVASPPPREEPPQPATHADGHATALGAADTIAHADGQATALRAVGAMVLAADCLPIALGAPGAVAMLHAGWRGLAAGVIDSGLSALRELGAEAERVVAVLGPCAGPCCYEVGAEVHAALASGVEQKAPIDLRALARRRLAALGVRSVAQRGGCTICEQRYFSHRREGLAAGRQAGIAWLS